MWHVLLGVAFSRESRWGEGINPWGGSLKFTAAGPHSGEEEVLYLACYLILSFGLGHCGKFNFVGLSGLGVERVGILLLMLQMYE